MYNSEQQFYQKVEGKSLLSRIKAKIPCNIRIYIDPSCQIIKCKVNIYVRGFVLYINRRVSMQAVVQDVVLCSNYVIVPIIAEVSLRTLR